MLRLGFINFWERSKGFIRNTLIDPLIENGINVDPYQYNPIITKCDIVIYSTFRNPENLKQCLGNPIFICYSGENRLDEYLIPECFSISFKEDTETNLYYPLWQISYKDWLNYRIEDPLKYNKSRFCLYIISNQKPQWRNTVFKELCGYKKVDSVGKALNNTGFQLPYDFLQAKRYTKHYKFNLCFENSKSYKPSIHYITEKIINAYLYGTVPIYWGDPNIEKWFNPRSFINCNGRSLEEIKEIITYYDTHDSEYNNMLSESPFYEDINWYEYAINRYCEFIKNIIEG